ncbi:YciI family protein [Ruegeria atlantica]|uniref:YciI family protein n=1 Tax=Ruegeria atlantica TaxID=81569 RepID=UPI0024955DE8|nr:YciI family protein [Ruegeria atlantica]
MNFIILFEDAPQTDPSIRKNHMPQHLSFLERHAPKIEAAGPLSDPERQGRDGLWLVDVDSIEDAESLIKEDPFWETGLRASYSIIPWRLVFSAGSRLI